MIISLLLGILKKTTAQQHNNTSYKDKVDVDL